MKTSKSKTATKKQNDRFTLSPAKKELLGHIELLCSDISEKGMEKLIFCARDISIVEAWHRGESRQIAMVGKRE